MLPNSKKGESKERGGGVVNKGGAEERGKTGKHREENFFFNEVREEEVKGEAKERGTPRSRRCAVRVNT